MKVDRNTKALVLHGEDGDTLTVRYDNRGEPYREGVQFELRGRDYGEISAVFLEPMEGIILRNKLNELFPR